MDVREKDLGKLFLSCFHLLDRCRPGSLRVLLWGEYKTYLSTGGNFICSPLSAELANCKKPDIRYINKPLSTL
ncbi:hypothetical protein PAMP_011991 [Pampus punctatissimus]